MEKFRRKKFLAKENFQIAFIVNFIALLFTAIVLTSIVIFKSSSVALQEATFKSHITIERSGQIIAPIILKVNIYAILISIAISSLIAALAYYRMSALFDKIRQGFRSLKENNTAFRIKPEGRKKTRKLIQEFNHAASLLDKRRLQLQETLDTLLAENELKRIAVLQNKLYSIISNKSS